MSSSITQAIDTVEIDSNISEIIDCLAPVGFVAEMQGDHCSAIQVELAIYKLALAQQRLRDSRNDGN